MTERARVGHRESSLFLLSVYCSPQSTDCATDQKSPYMAGVFSIKTILFRARLDDLPRFVYIISETHFQTKLINFLWVWKFKHVYLSEYSPIWDKNDWETQIKKFYSVIIFLSVECASFARTFFTRADLWLNLPQRGPLFFIRTIFKK